MSQEHWHEQGGAVSVARSRQNVLNVEYIVVEISKSSGFSTVASDLHNENETGESPNL